MFNWLKKQALVRQGLSCGKSRMISGRPDWRVFAECNTVVRVLLFLICLLFIIRIGSWQSSATLYETSVLSFMVLVISFIVINLSLKEISKNNYLLVLLLGCTVLNLVLNKALVIYAGEIRIFETSIPALLVPSALAPMLISILISPQAGFVTAFLVALLCSLFINANPGLFLSSLLTGFGAAYFTQNIRRRSDLLMAGLGIACVGLGCAILIGRLITPSIEAIFVQGVWAIILGLFTSFIVGAILPVLEWMFDRITDISWLELSDLNHPLLKRMANEAPGSYHHSLNVANLAEAAAEAIGANGSQCRVCAYFHDIGKLIKPQYFVENYRGDNDPHSQLNPSMSALIIISHVKEGVSLALKHRLRQPIIDVIQEHHGNSLVYYFYKRALQQQKDAIEGGKILKLREEDIPDVDERSFRYPGPIPQTRESAIISLADAIESASRTLKNPNAQRIEGLVKEIVEKRVEDGQLDESQLTFNELSILTSQFVSTLKNMLHARIEYPKDRKEDAPKDRGRDPQPAAPVPDPGAPSA